MYKYAEGLRCIKLNSMISLLFFSIPNLILREHFEVYYELKFGTQIDNNIQKKKGNDLL